MCFYFFYFFLFAGSVYIWWNLGIVTNKMLELYSFEVLFYVSECPSVTVELPIGNRLGLIRITIRPLKEVSTSLSNT